MVEAGWYDDPIVPGGKRYWDGTEWTEHAQAPPTPGGTGPGFSAANQGPPPFDPTPAPVAQQPVYRGNQINDIGDWIGRSFKVVFSQFVPLTIFFVFQFIFGAIGYLLLHVALQDVAITSDGDLLNTNLGLLLGAGGLFILAALAGTVSLLASHHNLYGAHINQPPDWGQSLSVGFARLLRYIGIMLVLYIALYLIIAVVAGLIFGVAAAAGDSTGIVVALAVLAYIAGMVFLVWISIKLAFITVTAAVVPRGTSAIKAAWNATTGNFWPIFGRLLLLGLLVGVLFMVPYLVAVFALPALFFSQFGFLPNGDLAIDGTSVGDLDIFEFADFLPNPVAMLVFFGILMFLFTIIQSVSYSGTAALYADLGGPNSFGHTRR